MQPRSLATAKKRKGEGGPKEREDKKIVKEVGDLRRKSSGQG